VTLPGTGGTVNFVYDPFGRRVKKSSSSSTSVYVYDGADQLQEVDSTGTTVVARYTMGTGIDQPLAEARGATTSFYQADGLGSVTSLTDGTASIASTYTYDSFGNQTASTGTVVNPFRYTARELDSETGLMYYRARYYDQSNGRFASEDPLYLREGVNFYPYVKNNPVIYRDKTGTGGELALPWIEIGEIPVAGQIAVAGATGWLIGRGIGNIPIGHGYTVDDAVAATISSTILAYRNWKAPDVCRRSKRICDALYAEDISFCNSLPNPTDAGACRAQAMERYAACLAGKPIRPLPWRRPN
jgi:RHS repeat-associated protein